MKSIQTKILVTLVIIFFVIGFSTSAKSIVDSPEFTVVKSEPATEPTSETNPLAVIYPSILQDYRKQTKEYIKSFSKKEREYIIYIFSKGEKFFPKAIDVLDKHELPLELQMIPALESQFDANAVSPVGAVGYYQFMSELAKEYGLHIGSKYDERKNFTKSSIAAAKFFKDQLDYFNDDILLSVASYNCGPGRVRLAIKKAGKADANFWEIKRYLPFETRKFVMDFIAFNVIAANYDKFLNNKLDFNEPLLLTVPVPDSTLAMDSLTVKAL